MSSVRQHTYTNRSPYSGEPSLPTAVPHTQGSQIPINPERSHAPTEHVRRPHNEQVPGVYQIQGQQEVDGHIQELLHERFKDGVSRIKHLLVQILLFLAWAQKSQDLVVLPGLQLALRMLHPETSNGDFIRCCDKSSHRHLSTFCHL